ncbi:sialidase family protein [Carboxylicivirga sp. N1Y90]|uniref:sialidase family protein n=1 Tax=Carboxylicivirga fragile TaxID=3417571 RepID=UPI003D358013|nr:exo-alpha-sialidase [Marinilabiliaceae bacterium N1Y90]
MLVNKLIIWVLIFASTSVSAQKSNSIEAGVIENQDLFNASKNEHVACYRIPALITAPNGDLVAAIDERVPSCGDLKWSKDINIVVRRSSDNGLTWSEIETVVDFPIGQSASDPSMIVDEVNDAIFMFYNYMDLDKEKDVYYFHVVKSTDNGKSWSEPEDITAQIALPEWKNDFKFITSGRGIQTSKGVLLHTIVNLEKGGHVFGSHDYGLTWFVINQAIKPFDESKIIELNNGDWMINSRVKSIGHRYVHISKDEGLTWVSKADEQLVDPTCNASIIRYTSTKDGYDKDRLLFCNANHKKKRSNLTVKISYDEGKTWSKGKTIYKGGSAYSSLAILENGDIGVFFEKDGYKENPFVSFSLDWLTDGKDKYKKPVK